MKKTHLYLQYHFKSEFLFLILIIFVSMQDSSNSNLQKTEINIMIQGKDVNKVRNKFKNYNSFEYIINGVSTGYYLKEDFNNITIRFNQIITSSSNMFSGLDNIVEVDLSKVDFSQVTTMDSMFKDCKKLININFGNINTSSITDIDQMFFRCNSLTSVDLSKFNTSKVTTMK